MKSKTLVKILAWTVSLVVLTGSMAGCNKPADDSTKGTTTQSENTAASTNAATTTSEEPAKKQPVDLGGYEFVWGSLWGDEIYPEEGSSEQADLLYARYKQIEKDYNCKITQKKIALETIMEDVNTAIMAGDKFVDFLRVDYGRFQNFLRGNMLKALNEIPKFDVNQKKFFASATAAATKDGKVYGVDYQIPPYVGILMYFNKSLLEREGLASPYELVNNKQWNWEKFKEYAKACTKDKNGDGVNDIWGLVTTDWHANNCEKPLMWTNGSVIAKKGDDGKYKFALGDPQAQEALTFLNDLMYVNKVLKPNQQGTDPNQNVTDFVDGKVAFMINPSYAPEAWLTGMADDFGILPLPMGPQAKEYVALGNEIKAWIMTSTNSTADKAATIFDAITEPLRESLDQDMSSYYDTYRNNILRDDESLEIYKMMADRTVTDITWGMPGSDVLGQAIYSCVRDNAATPKSTVESIAGVMQGYIDEFFSQIDPEAQQPAQ